MHAYAAYSRSVEHSPPYKLRESACPERKSDASCSHIPESNHLAIISSVFIDPDYRRLGFSSRTNGAVSLGRLSGAGAHYPNTA
jgi:hypothetical protein